MNPEAVLKVGGSLSRGDGLEMLCEEIRRQGERHSLVVVPGGGKFADQVREVYLRYKLDETTAHRMALLAMDQYGYLLNRLIAGSSLITDLVPATQVIEPGVAVLLPSALIFRMDPLPHSWKVTSDTIAAWVARQIRSRLLVLLKDIDGLMTAGLRETIAELRVKQLAHVGGVDEYLCRFLASAEIVTWVINGLRPERLSELLNTGHTTGTRVTNYELRITNYE